MNTTLSILPGLLVCGFSRTGFLHKEPAASRQEVDAPAAQFRVGQAFRELRQRQHEAKLAEPEVLNTEEAYRHAQQQADARKALAVARADETAARQRYDQELSAVDRLQRQAK